MSSSQSGFGIRGVVSQLRPRHGFQTEDPALRVSRELQERDMPGRRAPSPSLSL